ncbi:MAG: phage tail protein [bacterium]|nr:phage tail protein [bacterium]
MTSEKEKKKKAVQEGYAADFRFLVMMGQGQTKGGLTAEQTASGQKMRFSKVSGLESSMEYEELSEGGKNDAPYILAVPHKKHAPLLLEHGIVPAESRFAGMKPGMRLGTWLSVILLDAKGQMTDRRFWITDGIVTKRETGNLDAMGNSILIERFEIMHDGIQYT